MSIKISLRSRSSLRDFNGGCFLLHLHDLLAGIPKFNDLCKNLNMKGDFDLAI